MSLSHLPELSEEELWQEKWNGVKRLRDELWEVVEQLMKKGRIPCEVQEKPIVQDWCDVLLPTILMLRLNLTLSELRKYDAFHPCIYSSYTFELRHAQFDTKNNGGIENCMRSLLRELRKENVSSNTGVIEF